MKYLVLGIGNSLLRDEGAGLHAMRLLQARLAGNSDIAYVDGGTLGFSLAEYIERATSVLVFDAFELHEEAGSIRTFSGAEMDAFLGRAKRSAHEVALLDLLDIARLTDTLPRQRALIGIQPQVIDWGLTLSPMVQAALPVAVNEAIALLRRWEMMSGEMADLDAEHSTG